VADFMHSKQVFLTYEESFSSVSVSRCSFIHCKEQKVFKVCTRASKTASHLTLPHICSFFKGALATAAIDTLTFYVNF